MKLNAGTSGDSFWSKYKDRYEKKDVNIPGSSRMGRMFGSYGKAVFKVSNKILSWLWSFLSPILFAIPAVVILVVVIALLIFDAIIKFQIRLYWELGNEAKLRLGKVIGGMLSAYLHGLALILKGLLDSLVWVAKMTVKGVLYCVSGATTAISGVALEWMQGGAILGNKYDLIGNTLDTGEIEEIEEEHKKKFVEITYTENQNFEINRVKTLADHEKKADMLQYSFRFGKYWEQALATGLVREQQLKTYYDLVNGQSENPTDSSMSSTLQNSENKAGKIKDVYYWRYKEAIAEKERLEKVVRDRELNIVNTSKKSSEEIDLEIKEKENQKKLLQNEVSIIDNDIKKLKEESEQEQKNKSDEINKIIDKYKKLIENTSDEDIKKMGEGMSRDKLIDTVATPQGVKAMLEQQIEELEYERVGMEYDENGNKIYEDMEKELESKFQAMDDGKFRVLYCILAKEANEKTKEDVEAEYAKISEEEFDEKKFKEENDYEGFQKLIRIKDIKNSIENAEKELKLMNDFVEDIDSKNSDIQDKIIERENINIQIEDLEYSIKDLKAYKSAGSSSVLEDEDLNRAKANLKEAKENLYKIYMEDNLLYAIEDDGEFSDENKVNYIMDLYYEDEEFYPELKEEMPDLLRIEIDYIEDNFNRLVGGASGFDDVSIDEALNAMVQRKYGGYGYPKSYYTKKTADNENVMGAQIYTYEKTAITAPENLKLVKIYMDYEPIERGQKVVCMNFVSEDGAREYKVMGIEEISRFFNAKAKQDYANLAESSEYYDISITEDGSLVEEITSEETGEKSSKRISFTEKDYTYEHIIIPEGVIIGTFGKNIVPLLERRKAEELQDKIRKEQDNISKLRDNEASASTTSSPNLQDNMEDETDEDGLTNEKKIELSMQKIEMYKQQVQNIQVGDVYDYIFVELNEDSTNSVLDVEPDFIIPVYEKGKYRFAVSKKEVENGFGSRIYGGAVLAERGGIIEKIGYDNDEFSILVKYNNGNTKTYTEATDNLIAFSDNTKALLDKIDPYWNSKYFVFNDDEFEIEKKELLGTIPDVSDSRGTQGVYAIANYKILNVTFNKTRDDIKSFELLDVETKKSITYTVISSKSGRYGGTEIQKLSESMKNKLKNYDKHRITTGETIGMSIDYDVFDNSNDASVRKTSLNRTVNEIKYEGSGYCEILEVGRDGNGLLKIKLMTIPDYKVKEYVGLIAVGSKVTDKLSNVFNMYNDNYDETTDSNKYNKDYVYSYAKWNEKYYDVINELKAKEEMQNSLENGVTNKKYNEDESKIAAYEAIAFKGRVIKGGENGEDLYFDDLGEETEIIAPENCIITGAGWSSDTGYTLQLTSLDYERRYTFSELNSFSSWINGVLGSKLGPDWKDSGRIEEIDEYRIIEKGEKIGRMGASKGPKAGEIPLIAPETLRVVKFGRVREDGDKKYCVTLESLDGERTYEIQDMDILSQMANTGINGDLRKSNRKVKLDYNEVEYDRCYMLTDAEVIDKKLYKKAYLADNIIPGSSISNSDETYGKGYGIRPLYIYEGEIIGYAKMKKVQNTAEKYARGDEGNKIQTKIKVKNNKFMGYDAYGVEKSSGLIIRKKAKVSDLFDAYHVNVSVEKFDNLIPDNFEERMTSRVVKIQNVERTDEGFNLKYREGNHRVNKIICYDNKGEVIVTNELVYAVGNKSIDKIEYYKKGEEKRKEKRLKDCTRTKIKDEETNSNVIELTIPIIVPNNRDNVARISIYDSTGNSVVYNIFGISKVTQRDGLTTVTVVAPENVGTRRIELYDKNKNIIMAKDVDYKNKSVKNFDFEIDKKIDQIKLYGYDGSMTVWKPEITYISKIDKNTIKVEYIEGMGKVERIEYYNSNDEELSLRDDEADMNEKINGNKHEIVAKVPDAYDVKNILIYDKDGKYTEYKCLDIKNVNMVNDAKMDIEVVIDKNDGIEMIECYDRKDKLRIREKEINNNQQIYSIDIGAEGLEYTDIKEIRVYSINGEIAHYMTNEYDDEED